ncbi:MAG: hypothetical protein AAF515_13465 [Pseudomonadota bacterium]
MPGRTRRSLPQDVKAEFRPSTSLAVLALTFTSIATPAYANDGLEIALLATSDWRYHGISETRRKPAIGIAFDWQVSETFFAGLEAHHAQVEGALQRQRSLMAYVGAGTRLGNDWYLSGSVSHREFPGSRKEWDFTEFEAQATRSLSSRSQVRFSVDYSPDYYEHNIQAWGIEGQYTMSLNDRWYVTLEAGRLAFSKQTAGPEYGYGRLGAGWRADNLLLEVSVNANTEGSDAAFGAEAYNDLVIVGQLTWRLR